MTRTPAWLRLIVGIGALLLIAPIGIIVIVSFGGDGYLKFPPSSLSLQWYEVFFGDGRWWDALWASAIIALVASLFSTTIGFLGAYVLVRSSSRFRTALLALALTPMIVPQVITAIAMFYVSSQLGLVGNLVWVSICHSVIALPIVLLILLATLRNIDPALERAAAGMGCSRLQTFRLVVIPLALPGVVSAALFSFLASFDELIISLFLTGVRTQTLPVKIWNSLLLEVEPTIAAVSTFLVAITVIVLLADWAIRKASGTLETGA
ncbi:putative spermidine/putrescine transport system permease protein [Rhodopseudomonas julia]|uniref:Spermidine/putrescine transport system permease protein n=1 Tax=Rhodopseudomonas julia TaxID=200617 RepID=A0ABU0CAQ0_9BRAD|nr:ABC transporter permease [Rhodopseudomonas julia]MDQ0327610.1 putative spermidine/putrescine transport system permease protein [Rhodopseudomonas julia]